MSTIRFRFSILNMLMLMTIIALAISVVLLWRKVGPLWAEVHQLRNEVGMLAIDDRSKIHIIRVNTRDELTWKWRVWVPQGKSVQVRCTDDIGSKAGSVNGSSIATSSGTIWLRDPGENVVEFRIDKDRRTDRWNGALYANTARVGNYEQPWVNWPGTNITSSGIGTQTQSFDFSKPIELIRYVVTESAIAGKPKPTTAPSGFVISIEPAK